MNQLLDALLGKALAFPTDSDLFGKMIVTFSRTLDFLFKKDKSVNLEDQDNVRSLISRAKELVEKDLKSPILLNLHRLILLVPSTTWDEQYLNRLKLHLPTMIKESNANSASICQLIAKLPSSMLTEELKEAAAGMLNASLEKTLRESIRPELRHILLNNYLWTAGLLDIFRQLDASLVEQGLTSVLEEKDLSPGGIKGTANYQTHATLRRVEQLMPE